MKSEQQEKNSVICIFSNGIKTLHCNRSRSVELFPVPPKTLVNVGMSLMTNLKTYRPIFMRKESKNGLNAFGTTLVSETHQFAVRESK